MNVLQNVVIDMLDPRKTIIHVVQGDNARGVELTLLAGNAPFDVSSDLETGETLNNYVEFRKPDGHGGTYDHTSLGVPAVTQKTGTNNVWILAFDTECFSVPGWTQINVRFETNTGRVIQTFALCADVEPSAGVNEGSGDWDNTGGFNDQVKAALLNLLDHVQYDDDNKEQYLTELANAMYRPHGVTYITAVFDESYEVYATDTLDDLRPHLTVTAHWEDGSSEDVLSYTLSGTLTAGTSVITVAYSGKTTTVNITVLPIRIVPWSTGTDKQISDMLDAAHRGDIDLQTDGGWAVGDTRTIHIDAFTGGGNKSHSAQDVEIVITSFGDYNNCGCVMQFDFKNCLSSTQRVYASNTNTGGYGASEMKSTTIPALISALPEWLKDRLIEFDVVASLADSYDNISVQTVTGNKLALRAAEEIRGVSPYNNSAHEGALADYYSTSENRIKKRGTSNSNYSTRSAYPSSMFLITTGGAASSTNANTETGFAPFGCV